MLGNNNKKTILKSIINILALFDMLILRVMIKTIGGKINNTKNIKG